MFPHSKHFVYSWSASAAGSGKQLMHVIMRRELSWSWITLLVILVACRSLDTSLTGRKFTMVSRSPRGRLSSGDDDDDVDDDNDDSEAACERVRTGPSPMELEEYRLPL